MGIEVVQSKESVVISQRKYALDTLKETNMIDCKPVDGHVGDSTFTRDKTNL